MTKIRLYEIALTLFGLSRFRRELLDGYVIDNPYDEWMKKITSSIQAGWGPDGPRVSLESIQSFAHHWIRGHRNQDFDEAMPHPGDHAYAWMLTELVFRGMFCGQSVKVHQLNRLVGTVAEAAGITRNEMNVFVRQLFQDAFDYRLLPLN